jgi:ribose transport system permease protein
MLHVVAAVVIGGARLSGSSGGLLNSVLALGIIGVLSQGMAFLDISPDFRPVMIGIATTVAVLTDRAIRFRRSA